MRAHAEALPLEDGAFTVAVSTLVRCTVEDQAPSLAEIRRVLEPGGELTLHRARSLGPAEARPLNGFNRVVARGGNCNFDTVAAILAAGFSTATS